ncbi:mitochondrial carrier protein [Chloropicon primus]|uniref:Mitochondrial carrier protein n=1 Tax=Chloropicon primus TaxID=1764295 RepID=A0A5B8MPR0_9CHLO|nr:mitochondrial carrier protein [Chloropicon primus]UPR01882.1 mitochondrial carrier protein [Chloropicon primus]|mmetsp:Transcript_14377/g.40903  ORF Transcript_14377/g.40903 Transcript_14377/m.40903 type:complete len:296 (+) Transcript_14377:396-1283(+)|eukprot:QDZ22658.1 mitochondrial carrier protein [Chloropicon primus]
MDLREFVAGTAGGCAGVFAGHPLDVVKTRLQSGTNALGANVVECFRKLFVKEGLKGFYKGILPPIVSNAPVSAGVFTTYGWALRQLHGSERQHEASLRDVAKAGFAAGVVSSVIVTPADLIKVRLQMDSKAKAPSAGAVAKSSNLGVLGETYGCVQQIVREGGLPNLYRGFKQTLLRETFSYACYFGSYEATLRSITPEGKQPSTWSILLAGSVSGLVVWGPVYPIDVVKTRIQACKKETPDTTWRCTQQIIASEGVKGLFRGFSAAMLRAVPVNAITFLVFEQVQLCLPQWQRP